MLRNVKKLSLLLALICGTAMAQSQNTAPNAIVAEIDGHSFTGADLEAAHPTSLFQARNAFYKAERKAVEEFVDEILLVQQAQKENVTVAELLNEHVNRTIAADPSEEALKVYYEGVDTNQSFEAVRDKIIESLRQRRIAKAKAAYIKSMREQAQVSIRLSQPKAQLALQNTPVRGQLDAPVLLVEYADYECPYCQQLQPTLHKLEAEYKGRMAFAYKDMPLPMHAHAEKAAEASHCAEMQGSYWEYHDMLASSKQLDIAALKAKARLLKIDGERFDQCLENGEKAATVKAELVEAQRLGLEGTPSLFINGHFFSGAPTYEALRSVIEEELKGASAERQKTAMLKSE